MILIENGKIIKNDELVTADVLVDGEKIVAVGAGLKANLGSKACEVIDASGCLVMPGAVDVHTHLREPGFEKKETIATGTLSAAKGGVTTMMSMPNLFPCPDNKANLQLQLELIKKSAVVRVIPYGAVSVLENGKELSDISDMKDDLLAITDDGRGVNNIALLKEAMELAKRYNIVIASHAEDEEGGYEPRGEFVAVRREIELAKQVGCRYHFCHMSTKESFEAIRKARAEGYTNITCEVAPHHLLLNKTHIKNPNWKMNPPLRSEEDRLAAVAALLDGTACIVASDHAPHTEEEKSRAYEDAPNGIIGVETLLPAIYTHFVRTGQIGWGRFLEAVVERPCEIFGLGERRLEAGFVADIAVLDISNERVYTKDEILSKGKNSPFIGEKFYGFNVCTLVGGKVVWRA